MYYYWFRNRDYEVSREAVSRAEGVGIFVFVTVSGLELLFL